MSNLSIVGFFSLGGPQSYLFKLSVATDKPQLPFTFIPVHVERVSLYFKNIWITFQMLKEKNESPDSCNLFLFLLLIVKQICIPVKTEMNM